MKKVIFLLFLLVFANAQIILPNINTHIIKDTEYFIDHSNEATIKNIDSFNFTNAHKELLNFGHTNKNIWLKLHIKSNMTKEYIIDYGKFLVDYLDVHYIKNKKIIQSYYTGNKRENTTKALKNSTFIFPISLEKDEEITVYFKIKSSKLITIPLKIKEKIEFKERAFYGYLFVTAFFTTLLIMSIYNLIIFFITKKSIFSHYSLYLFSSFLCWFVFDGYSACFLFESYPTINQILLYISIGLYYCAFTRFILNLYSVEKSSSFLVEFLRFITIKLIPITVVLTIISMFVSINLETIMNMLFLLFRTAILVFLTLLILSQIKKRNLLKKIYSSFLFVKVVILLIFLFNLYNTFLDINFLTDLIQASQIFETIAMSLILGYNLKIYEKNNQQLKTLNKKQKKILLENYKLSTYGNILKIIAHQLKQPLNNLNSIPLSIETRELMGKLDKDFLFKKLSEIETQTQYMDNTIDNFLGFLNPNKKKQKINISLALEETLNLLNSTLLKHNICYRIKSSKDIVYTQGYKEEYIQVLLILINNSIEAISKSKSKDPKVSFFIYTNKKIPTFIIKDNGGGVKKEIINRIFEPNFTTKKEKNSGLGLFFAKHILEAMGKKITCKNSENGMIFKIIG